MGRHSVWLGLAAAFITGCGGGGGSGAQVSKVASAPASATTSRDARADAVLVDAAGNPGPDGPDTSMSKVGEAPQPVMRPLATSPFGPRSRNPGMTLTALPNELDVAFFQGESRSVKFSALASRLVQDTTTAVLIDPEGMMPAGTQVSGGYYIWDFSGVVKPDVVPGVYTGRFELRLCYDGDPRLCVHPLEGSPLFVPYRVQIIDPTAAHFSRWERAQTTPGFLSDFALATQAGRPVVVTAGPYTRLMETWTTADMGSSWQKLAVNAVAPLRRGFSLASADNAVYLVGGEVLPAQSGSGTAGTEQFVNDVWKFDGSTWQLMAAAAPFAARQTAVLIKLSGSLYVAGGKNGTGALRDIWRSDDEGSTWAQLSATVPTEVGVPTCAVAWRQRLVLIGDKITSSADGESWTVHEVPARRFPKGSVQCAVWNDRLFVTPATSYSNYDPRIMSTDDLQTWQIEHDFVPGSSFPAPGMVALEGRLLVVSGSGTSERTTFRTVP